MYIWFIHLSETVAYQKVKTKPKPNANVFVFFYLFFGIGWKETVCEDVQFLAYLWVAPKI